MSESGGFEQVDKERCEVEDCDETPEYKIVRLAVAISPWGSEIDTSRREQDVCETHYRAAEGWAGKHENRFLNHESLGDAELATDGGSVKPRDPTDDPFACSICGQPLSTLERVENGEHCDGCLRDYGFVEGESHV